MKRVSKKLSAFLVVIMVFSIVLSAVSQLVIAAEKDEPAKAWGSVSNYSSFRPGSSWTDTDGTFIQAHGGQVIWLDDEDGGKWWWYGEDKYNGRIPIGGVHAYSSVDLYNWTDEGVVLRVMSSEDDFYTDYFQSLYGDTWTAEELYYYLDANFTIMERPKVLYNEATGKYVMWFHSDGPSDSAYEARDTSASRYTRAYAGVAVSDSPNGPFTFLRADRLNYVDSEYSKSGGVNSSDKNQGMARDMTVFQDDDGSAYVIYSSENNAQTYISKLNDEYTWLSKTNEEGAVYGEDFVTRIFSRTSREAPAIFKYDGKYYAITSGTDGWNSTKTYYYSADSMLADSWTEEGDPFTGTAYEGMTADKSFDSQSTYVIPVDAENGKFIYMGDRWWDPGVYGTQKLGDSRYIWLPITIENNDGISISYHDNWSLDILGTADPEIVLAEEGFELYTLQNQMPELPDTLEVTLGGSAQAFDAAVEWDLTEVAEKIQTPGVHRISAFFPEYNNWSAAVEIMVSPEDLLYFVNPTNSSLGEVSHHSRMMELSDTLVHAGVPDQAYSAADDISWGYTTSVSGVNSSNEHIFSTVRYFNGSSSGTGRELEYKFDGIEKGQYDIYIGFYDPWWSYVSSGSARAVSTSINGETVETGRAINRYYEVASFENIVLREDGTMTIVFSPDGSGDNTNIQVSWIMIAESANPYSSDTPIEMTGELTAASYEGTVPQLPETIEVLTVDGNIAEADVQWDISNVDFENISVFDTVTVYGTIEGSPLEVSIDVEIVPQDLVYFIDSGLEESRVYNAIAALAGSLKNEKPDGVYTEECGWGYVFGEDDEKPGTSGTAGTKYDTGLWAQSNLDIVYQLYLEAGTYSFVSGYKEFWGQWNSSRPMKAAASYVNGNGETVSDEVTIPLTNSTVLSVENSLSVLEDGVVTFTVKKTGNLDPVISWLAVFSRDYPGELLEDPEMGVFAAYKGTVETSLPETIKVKTTDGIIKDAAIDWNISEETFGTSYDTVAVDGIVQGSDFAVNAKVEVIPQGIQYFIDGGSRNVGSDAYDAIAEFAGEQILNEQSDRATPDGSLWGSGTAVAVDGTVSARVDKDLSRLSISGGAALTYILPLKAGTYKLTSGHTNISGDNNTRNMGTRVSWKQDGETITQTLASGVSISPSNARVAAEGIFTITEDTVVTFAAQRVETNGGFDARLSWLGVERIIYTYEAAYVNQVPNLPEQVESAGEFYNIEKWDMPAADAFSNLYDVVEVAGWTEEGYEVTAYVEVIPVKLYYFIDSNGKENGIYDGQIDGLEYESPVYQAIAELSGEDILNSNAADQLYVEGVTDWGLVIDPDSQEAKAKTPTGGYSISVPQYDKLITTGWYMNAKQNNIYIPLTYRLWLPAGSYEFTSGHLEWWNQGSGSGKSRVMKASVKYGEDEAEELGTASFGDQAQGEYSIISGTVTLEQDGYVDYTVSQNGGTEAPLLSWLGVYRHPDSSDLKQLLEEEEQLGRDAEDYSEESWRVYGEAIQNAVIVAGNTEASWEEIENALAALKAAISNLGVDKSALEELVDEYKELENDNYTDDSWNAFQNALSEAQAILDNQDSVQKAINEVLENLRAAFNGLEEANIDVVSLDIAYGAVFAGNPSSIYLPKTVEATYEDSSVKEVTVEWNIAGLDFAAVYETVAVAGSYTENGITVETNCYVDVVPEDIVYFIDSNGTDSRLRQDSPVYEAVYNLAGDQLRNKVSDQSFDNSWGYAGKVTSKDPTGGYSTSINYYSKLIMTGWYGSEKDDDITYSFELSAGTYTITSGHIEWWNTSIRNMNMSITYDGSTENAGSVSFPKQDAGQGLYDTNSHTFTLKEDGIVEYTVASSSVVAPVISWVAVVAEEDEVIIVDKDELQKLYDQCIEMKQENYTDESWAIFVSALVRAGEVLRSETADQDEVEDALAELEKALNGLKEKEIVDTDETDPVDTDETDPIDTDETDPVDTDETDPIDTDETDPVDTDETDPVDTDETDPVDTDETDPVDTDETDPVDTNETDPVDTDETDPVDTDETDPVDTDETDPADTDETDPADTDETDPVDTDETDPADTDETDPVDTDETDPPVEPVTRKDLEELVLLYTDIIKGDYTEDSWADFQVALENARSVLLNADSSQTDIQSAYEALDNAHAALSASGQETDSDETEETKGGATDASDQGNEDTENTGTTGDDTNTGKDTDKNTGKDGKSSPKTGDTGEIAAVLLCVLLSVCTLTFLTKRSKRTK